ncbi:MAG: hypothetical protein LBM65_05060 [Oscillospiraceae bacterium]|jgi:hypothetical protein|nr:hypothetical protein [Oscillospiraceae bacterium]
MAAILPEGYRKKSREEILGEIDNCKSISQIFALVQHENINMRMHTLPGASNIPPKRLEITEFAPNQTYLDKLKAAVRLTVENTYFA